MNRKQPIQVVTTSWGFPGGSVIKNLPDNAGDAGDTSLIPRSGRSPGGGYGKPIQYPCLENSMDKRSLVGYSPWHHKELETTELTTYILYSTGIYIRYPVINYNGKEY